MSFHLNSGTPNNNNNNINGNQGANNFFEYDGFKASVNGGGGAAAAAAPQSPMDGNFPGAAQKNEKDAGLKPIDTFSLAKHTMVKDRWEILIKIGQGAFGQTYTALDKTTNEQVAIKVEPLASKKQVLKVEVSLLRKLQDSPYVTRFIGCGRQEDFNFLVMELLGKSVSDLRRKKNDHVFTLSTTALLAHQMLDSIEAVHNHGYLHRDVKPSNFVMGLKKVTDPRVGFRARCYIIDFGLSRRHLSKDNAVREARDIAGFRGTARYASIAAHLNLELGRKDDIWSLFYIIIEFLVGGLPWRKEKEKEKIGEIKQKCHGPSLVENLPRCMLDMMAYLNNLNYADRPNYDYIHSLIQQLFEASKDPLDVPYDWEKSLVAGQSGNNSTGLGNSNGQNNAAYMNSSIVKKHMANSGNNLNNQSGILTGVGKSNADNSISSGGGGGGGGNYDARNASRSFGNFDATSGFLPVAASSVTHHGLESMKISQDVHSNNLSTTFFSNNTTSNLGFTTTTIPGVNSGSGNNNGSQADRIAGRMSRSGLSHGGNASNASLHNNNNSNIVGSGTVGGVLSRKSSRIGTFPGQLLMSNSNNNVLNAGSPMSPHQPSSVTAVNYAAATDSPRSNNNTQNVHTNANSPGFFQKLAEKLHLRPASPTTSDPMQFGNNGNIPEIRVAGGSNSGVLGGANGRQSQNDSVSVNNNNNQGLADNKIHEIPGASLAKKIEPLDDNNRSNLRSSSHPNMMDRPSHANQSADPHKSNPSNNNPMAPLSETDAGSLEANTGLRKNSSPSSFLRSLHLFQNGGHGGGTSGKSKSVNTVAPTQMELDNHQAGTEKTSRGIFSRFRKFRKKGQNQPK